MEPVFVRNTLKNTWESAVVMNRPQPIQNPRTYLVDIRGKVYQRKREHLKPRSINQVATLADSDPLPMTPMAPTPNPLNTPAPAASVTKTPTPVKPNPIPNTSTTPSPASPGHPRSPMRPSPQSQVVVVKKGKVSYQPKSQTTRTGLVTQVPNKFKDWMYPVQYELWKENYIDSSRHWVSCN